MTGTDQIGSQSVENTDKVEDIEVLKKNYADSTREAVFLAEANKVLKDNTYLAKVAKNDRKLAEKISQDTWWISIDDALEQLQGNSREDEPANNGGSLSKEDMNAWYEEKKVSEKVNEKFDSITKSLGIEEGGEDHDVFMEEYRLLTSGKNMTPELVSKFAKIAYTEIKGWDVEAVKKAKAIVSAQSISASPAWEGQEKDKPKFEMPNNGPSTWY